jgi:hypothetical protein
VDETILMPIKPGDKTDCINYRGVSLLTSLFLKYFSRHAIPYADEIIGETNADFGIIDK